MGERPVEVHERRPTRAWNVAGCASCLATPLALAGPVALTLTVPRLLESADLRERLVWASASAAAALGLVVGVLAVVLWTGAVRRRAGRATLRDGELRFELHLAAQPFTLPVEAIEALEESPHGLLVRCGQGWWSERAFPLLIPLDSPEDVARLFAALSPAARPPLGPPPSYSGSPPRRAALGGAIELAVLAGVLAGPLWMMAGVTTAFARTPQDHAWGQTIEALLATMAVLAWAALARDVQARLHGGEVQGGQVRFRGPLGEETFPLEAVRGHRWAPGRGLWLRIPARGARERWLPRLLPAATSAALREALAALHAGGARCCARTWLPEPGELAPPAPKPPARAGDSAGGERTRAHGA